MKKIKSNKGGFTLVELLIAMSIFMIFTGILINSYGHLVRTQQKTNQYRELYAQAREVFEVLVGDLRENAVDYAYSFQCGSMNGFNGPVNDLYLISKDAGSRTRLLFDGEKKAVFKFEENVQDQPYLIFAEENGLRLNNNEVLVEDLRFYVSPKINPYSQENFAVNFARFHPKVTLFATFAVADGSEDFRFNLQTTVSSRFYNEIYPSKCQ